MGLLSSLVSTYSIVAVDREAKVMGAAVQSHFFSVGSIISWADAGIGVVATQSLVMPEYGPRGLALLELGLGPTEVLAALTAADKAADVRQVAILSPHESAVHTGSRCIAEAGHICRPHFSVQANMMMNPGVPEAMAETFESTEGRLESRMMAALRAAESQGGDIRGRQSAAVLLVSTEATPKVREARPLDLRVEDHPEPLTELQRLLQLHHAYAEANAGDAALAEHSSEDANLHYRRARAAAPHKLELRFWEAMGRAAAGEIGAAREALKELDAESPCWRELAHRLPITGLIRLDPAGWDALLSP
ncbi:MAG: DUF1028 domain-containing protein [Spirochaetaceae bacterium]|nr:MAG: DUF1028 domain-containing protein [Spirochaetaceae bacterium]